MAMKVYIGADHRGFKLKESVKSFLVDEGYDIEDLGAIEETPNDDYVDFAKAVGEKIVSGGMGLLFCGSGAGMEVAANKIKGVRAANGLSNEQVKAARNDDDINCLSIASDYISEENAKTFILSFLKTEFSPTENHTRRVEKIRDLENS